MKCFMSGKECEFHTQVDPYKVFVISPFGYPFDDIYKHGIQNILKDIKYEDIVGGNSSPGVNSTLKADRADQALQLGFVMCQKICKKIQESNFIIEASSGVRLW